MASDSQPLGKLTQIQVRFDPIQDRLLVRINTSTRSQLRCWLTRRIVQRLWPALENALGQQEPELAVPTPEARSAVVGMRREEALAKADFSATFEEKPLATPLGEEPLLISRVRLQRTSNGHVLRLDPAKGAGFNLQLENQTLHSFCELVRRSAEAAEWSLGLTPAGEAVAIAETPAQLN